MKIYRLENYKGKGPFSASQQMALCLVSHRDPEYMLDSVKLSREDFERLTNIGAVFGWSSRELMIAFFRDHERSVKKASEMKMKISVYEEDEYWVFEDGQVMFIRTKPHIERISLREFLFV